MMTLGVRALWAASAYAVFTHWAWAGVGSYAVATHLLRTHLPRLWGYQPMTASDAYFLIPTFPDPVYGVAIGLLSKTTAGRLKEDLENRVFPGKIRARQYPTTIFGKDYWVEDPNFNLNDHLISVPGRFSTLEELGAFTGKVVIESIPPNKPQWCAYFIEDFQGGSAVIVRFRHIYQDGIALVNCLAQNADSDCSRECYGLGKPSALRRLFLTPLALMLVPYGLLVGLQTRPDRNPLTGIPHNGEKTLSMSGSFPLPPHLAKAKSMQVSFNDYLTASVLRTISLYIAEVHGTQHHCFNLGIPVAMRGKTEETGNDITYLLLPMPSVASPTLTQDIHKLLKQATQSSALIQASNLILRSVTFLPKFISRKFLQRLGDNSTAAFTNVPGPKTTLKYGGIELKSMYLAPVAGLPVTAGVTTYAGQFTVTWNADKAVIKDVSRFTQIFEKELSSPGDRAKYSNNATLLVINMLRYRREENPFHRTPDTQTLLFHGKLTSANLSVVIKEHSFHQITEQSAQISMTQTLNAALTQVKLQHPSVCDILGMEVETDGKDSTVRHFTEELNTDLRKDIEKRKVTNTPHTVDEQREIIIQTSSALAHAHSQGVYHRYLTPTRISVSGNTYKVGGFGCFDFKRNCSTAKPDRGDQTYMSPQLREACRSNTPYSASKADVFALGASWLHMATGRSPEEILHSGNMNEAVQRVVSELDPTIRELMQRMLDESEEARPTMQEVYDQLLHDTAPASMPSYSYSLEAPEVAEASYLRAIATFNRHFPHTLELTCCLQNLGILYKTLKRYEAAESQFFQSITTCHKYFPESIEFGMSRANLGNLYTEMKRFDSAEFQYLQAVSIYNRSLPVRIGLARCHQQLGNLYKTWEKTDAAESHYLQAVSIYNRFFPETIDFARCLQTLAILYIEMKKYAATESPYLHAISIYSRNFPDHIEFSRCLQNLAILYKEMKRNADAENLYLQAIESYGKNYPETHDYARCLYILGDLYKEMKRFEDAESQYLKSTEIYMKNFPESIDCAKALSKLGDFYKEMKRFEEAEGQFLKATEIYHRKFPENIEFARCLQKLGIIYQEIEKNEEAESCFARANSIYTKNFPESIDYARCLNNFGILYQKTQRYEQAESNYAQAYAIFHRYFPQTIDFTMCLNNFGKLYRKMKRYEEAVSQYSQAVTIYRNHFPYMIELAQDLNVLGNIYIKMQRYEEAEAHFMQAVTVYSQNFPWSLQFARCLIDFKDFYELRGPLSKAIAQLKKALPIYLKAGAMSEAEYCRTRIDRLNASQWESCSLA